ncbi:CNVH-domain-containing protein [Aureobasidium sp. EXF-10728]|nr:CNVH-domain-containing protein [Aureobasidium sp. EXF-10728]
MSYNNYGGEAQGYYGGGQQQQGYGSGAPSNQYGDNQSYGGHQQHNNQYGGPQQGQYGNEQHYGGSQHDQGYGQQGGYQSHQQGYGQPQQALTARDEYPSQTHGGYGGNTSYQGSESAPYAPNQPSYGGQPGVEGDRGMMGALAGGAAGAYGGHKMNHGILGAIGGAFAGSKLEDFGKDHKKKKDEEKYAQQHQGYGAPGNYGRPGRRDSNSSSSSSSSDDSKKRYKRRSRSNSRNRGYQHQSSRRGNFSETSRDISLDYNTMALKALCRRPDGSEHESYLHLNDILGNRDGRFVWERNGNFTGSVKEGKIWLAEGGRALCAVLGDGRGGWNEHANIELDEKISNESGQLVYLG